MEKKYKWDDIELLDANEIGGMLERDPVLASYLPTGLIHSDTVQLQYSLDSLVEGYYKNYSVPIKDVVYEPLVDELINLDKPLLIYGPPNVGKTCWAIRQAWNWIKGKEKYSSAYLINASRDDAYVISRLSKYIPTEACSVFIIDDIHYAKDNLNEWLSNLDSVIIKRGIEKVKIIWIAREVSVFDKLSKHHVQEPKKYSYPVENVFRLFTERGGGTLGITFWPHLRQTLTPGWHLRLKEPA